MSNPIVTMSIRDRGSIKIELYPELAPNTVNNFISLVKKGFYNGLIFHRVIQNFMIQGGDPLGSGMGGPEYSIRGEFSRNGFQNDLKHTEGVISMARSSHPDSAGSQFFLMTCKSPHLDGEYAAFGKVVEGLELIMDLEKVKTNFSDRPLEDIVMEEVTVDTFGEEYPEPEKC